MRCFFPSLWEGLGEGAKLDAHKPSPQPSPKGRGRRSFKLTQTKSVRSNISHRRRRVLLPPPSKAVVRAPAPAQRRRSLLNLRQQTDPLLATDAASWLALLRFPLRKFHQPESDQKCPASSKSANALIPRVRGSASPVPSISNEPPD